MSHLRPFQSTINDAVFHHWSQGVQNVLVKSGTGTGKTVMSAGVIRRLNAPTASIAHRAELVSQKALSLAREGIPHRIIGSEAMRRNCVAVQMEEIGRNYYSPNARVGVCSIDSLSPAKAKNDSWFNQVRLWDMDEAHHVLRDNKWGQGTLLFPNALGLGWTATERRADGKGLGRQASGLFDVIVEGPEMRESIDSGYLTDYRIFAPPSDVDYSEVTVTASGDLSPVKLRAAVHASDQIVGDVVAHYKKISYQLLGRLGLGITFAVDVESAKEIAQAFRDAGVPSEVVTAKTPDLLRAQILRRFKRREVLQLINVDLFGEGVDIPAVEIVSMVRKTESWPLFVQQFGRGLRLLISSTLAGIWGTFTDAERLAHIAASEKPFGIIIDHVGNVIRHGLPDAYHPATLEDRARRSSGPSDAIPTRVCTNTNAHGVEGLVCAATYERFHKSCPFCGFYPEPPARNAPEFVDGDLYELDAETLAAMRGKVAAIEGAPRIPQHLDALAAAGVRKQHALRLNAQQDLRELIALWAGWQLAQGFDDSQSYRRFFHAFGIDVLSAQALGRPDAEALTLRLRTVLDQHGVTSI